MQRHNAKAKLSTFMMLFPVVIKFSKYVSPWGAGNCSYLESKVMTNLDSILKSRDITLPTKVHLVKAMVFPVVMY